MKRLFIFLALISISLVSFSQDQDEKEAIKKVIDKAYVQGIQNRVSIENIEKGFHPGFNLLGVDDQGSLTKYPIYTWESNVKRAVAAGQMPAVLTTAKYPMIDVTGNAAIAKVELYREGEQIFTDYLSLYKFDDGWKIVNKIYHRIPQK